MNAQMMGECGCHSLSRSISHEVVAADIVASRACEEYHSALEILRNTPVTSRSAGSHKLVERSALKLQHNININVSDTIHPQRRSVRPRHIKRGSIVVLPQVSLTSTLVRSVTK